MIHDMSEIPELGGVYLMNDNPTMEPTMYKCVGYLNDPEDVNTKYALLFNMQDASANNKVEGNIQFAEMRGYTKGVN